MATTAQIETVRGYIAEPVETNDWPDTKISAYIDSTTSLYAAAADIWGTKAAAYAALVDVNESGSSRSRSKLQEQALRMSKFYSDRVAAVAASPPATPVGIVIADLVRP